MKPFKDQIIFITGSTRGIGRQIAHHFAGLGGVPIILGRSEDQILKNLDDIRQKGGTADGFVCDVKNSENVQEIVNKVLDKHKRIDILINNAGITKDNLLLRMSESDFSDVINVNLIGAFNCTKAISKVMLKARKGRIVNISSVIGISGNIGQANYAASKAGLIGLTKSVALELASRGITVNAIAPGYIQTDMTAQLTDKSREQVLKKIPLGRFGTDQDIASVCAFLCSDQANYITGQTITVDGGMTI